ncbi:hypothetical protein ES332_A02G052800v1 [Gossypium tomentosum]|uniref:Uncharacterized protein n=1 Tax=Gossypium tomentosum TaxID=34277 RepID=A0A5D2RD59_GOSTO|nr:hypothetical protein ES332_A02G052800v1 [Gossypium tomentosum]
MVQWPAAGAKAEGQTEVWDSNLTSRTEGLDFCCSRGGESEFDRNSPSHGLSRSSGGLQLMVQGSWIGFKLVGLKFRRKVWNLNLGRNLCQNKIYGKVPIRL